MASSTIPLPVSGGQFEVTSVTGTYSIGKNTTGAFTASGTKSGWTPLGIVNHYTAYSYVYLYGMMPTLSTGSISIAYKGRNVNATTDSGSRTATFSVLWYKE